MNAARYKRAHLQAAYRTGYARQDATAEQLLGNIPEAIAHGAGTRVEAIETLIARLEGAPDALRDRTHDARGQLPFWRHLDHITRERTRA